MVALALVVGFVPHPPYKSGVGCRNGAVGWRWSGSCGARSGGGCCGRQRCCGRFGLVGGCCSGCQSDNTVVG